MSRNGKREIRIPPNMGCLSPPAPAPVPAPALQLHVTCITPVAQLHVHATYTCLHRLCTKAHHVCSPPCPCTSRLPANCCCTLHLTCAACILPALCLTVAPASCSWLLQVAHCSCKLLMAPASCSWLLQIAHGSCKFLMAEGGQPCTLTPSHASHASTPHPHTRRMCRYGANGSPPSIPENAHLIFEVHSTA